MSKHLALVSLALCAACSANPSRDAGSNDVAIAPPDVTQDALAEASVDAGAVPTLRTVPAEATSGASLLLDPFVTGDSAWGHFVAWFPGGAGVGHDSPAVLARSFRSGSPVGVRLPTVRLAGLAALSGQGVEMVTASFFSGSSRPVAARVWVAVDDANGAPSTLAQHAGGIDVAVLANAGAPTSATAPEPQRFTLTPDASTQRVLEGRTWVAFTLPAAMVPEGGYLVLTLSDLAATWWLAAPEVSVQLAQPLGPAIVGSALRERDRAVVRAYRARVQQAPTEPRRDEPGGGGRPWERPESASRYSSSSNSRSPMGGGANQAMSLLGW